MLNYRSFSDLDRCIATNLWRIPADVDLIAGIPRSGLMAANMLALHLNLPLTTVDELVEGRILSSGLRLNVDASAIIESARKIAVVDDSTCSGREMQRARARLEATGLGSKCVYVAIYAREQSVHCADIHFEICPMPRVFAWNLMHRQELGRACVDIDGVLCVDPTESENDDGPCYRQFVAEARPLFRPTYEIGTLVTCRLEKYRAETEQWLRRHDIRYRELVMWDLPDKKTRLAQGGHARFKASVYSARPESDWFIESSAAQAQEIANLSRKPVVCIETQSVCTPGIPQLVVGAARNTRRWVPAGFRHVLMKLNHAR